MADAAGDFASFWIDDRNVIAVEDSQPLAVRAQGQVRRPAAESDLLARRREHLVGRDDDSAARFADAKLS